VRVVETGETTTDEDDPLTREFFRSAIPATGFLDTDDIGEMGRFSVRLCSLTFVLSDAVEKTVVRGGNEGAILGDISEVGLASCEDSSPWSIVV